MIDIVPIVSRRKSRVTGRGSFAPAHAQSLNADRGRTLCGRKLVDAEMLEVGSRVDCGDCSRKMRRNASAA